MDADLLLRQLPIFRCRGRGEAHGFVERKKKTNY